MNEREREAENQVPCLKDQQLSLISSSKKCVVNGVWQKKTKDVQIIVNDNLSVKRAEKIAAGANGRNLVEHLYDQYSEKHNQVKVHNTTVCVCLHTHTCEE